MKLMIFFLIFVLIINCKHEKNKTEPDLSFHNIKARKELKAVLLFNSTDYYFDKGYPIGFQLYLLKDYCRSIDVKLTIITKDNYKEGFEYLVSKKADLLAYNNIPTQLGKTFFKYTNPHSQSRLVLIQRKDSLSKNLKYLPKINNIKKLSNKTIYLSAYSPIIEYAEEFIRKNHLNTKIIIDKDNTSENLIEMVSNKEIDYTVCEEKIGKPNMNLFTNIDYSFKIYDTVPFCWTTLKESYSLINSINLWLNNYKKTFEYKRTYTIFYNTLHITEKLEQKKEYNKNRKISKYDKTIKMVSHRYKWDWRLYAALIYQESKFKENLIGDGGSFGLLQLMPSVCLKYRISTKSKPEEQIIKGAKYIKYLENLFSDSVKDKEQLSKFILASYNAGHNHIFDAIELTKKYGKNPTLWDDNVENYLKLKSKPKYFNDPVVKYGYYRGAFTSNFVREVWERYNHYKNFTN